MPRIDSDGQPVNNMSDKDLLVDEIVEWIGLTLPVYDGSITSCLHLYDQLKGFYPKKFLSECFYVVVDEVPKPYHLKGRLDVMDKFLGMTSNGITYNNTFFIQEDYKDKFDVFCHELVHTVQWKHLGLYGFITRYIDELSKHGYREAPLEKMAFDVQQFYTESNLSLNIEDFIMEILKKEE